MILSLLLVPSLLHAASAQYAYAVDIKELGTQFDFQCLKRNYSTVFIRAYTYDKAGLGIEVYMIPDVKSFKSASTQVDEALTYLVNGGITVQTLWLQITSPAHWNQQQATNYNFILSAIQRIRAFQSRGIRPDMYTNTWEWQQITNNAGGLGNDVPLWYWSVNSMGVETTPDFSDFRAFGNWNSAAVKQFGKNEKICDFTANRDSYPLYSLKEKQLPRSGEDGHIYVGTIGL